MSQQTSVEHFASAVASTVRDSARPKMPPIRKDGPSGRFYVIDGDESVAYPSVTHVLSAIAKPALVNWAANQERLLVTDTAADLYLDLAKTPPMSRAAYVTTLQGRIGKTKAHQKALAKAGDIGTQAHAIIEWNLRQRLGQKVGPEPRIVDDAQWAFMAYEEWRATASLKPLFIEQTVFSRTHRYAGTMDLYAEMDTRAYLAALERSGRLDNAMRQRFDGRDRVTVLVDFKTSKSIYAEAHLQNVAYQAALSEMGHGQPDGGLIVRVPKVQTDPEFEVAAVPPVAELFPTFLAVLQLWRWWYAQDAAWRAKQSAKKEAVA